MELELDGVNADSLVQMLKASYLLDNWAGILLIADKLYSEINAFYKINQRERAAGEQLSDFGLRRSIVYYFGYSMCMKGIAFEKMGSYKEARECISSYEELGWINGLNTADWAEVDYYRKIAQANRFIIELYEGNIAILQDYLEFLRSFKEEVLPGVLYILVSAIKYRYNVDPILEEFKEQITAMGNHQTNRKYTRYYNEYIYLEARYYSINGKVCEAIKLVLQSLATSIHLKDNTNFRQTVALFETLRSQANPDQLAEYLNIMKQILN